MEISARLLGFTAYGVQWVLWMLIALSVISIGVMLERFWYFAVYHPSPRALAKEIRALLKTAPALHHAPGNAAAAAEALEAAHEGAKALERLRLERNLAFLGTLGSNAPFIGLFGTVLGIIKAFHDLAGNQSGGPAVVMAGISEALVATAVGLMVAIPAVVAFNYFNRRVRTSMTQVDWMAHLALAEVRAELLPAEGGAAAPETATAGADAAAGAQEAAAASFTGIRRIVPFAAIAGVLLLVGGIWFHRSFSAPAPAPQPVNLPPAMPSAPPPAPPVNPSGTEAGPKDPLADPNKTGLPASPTPQPGQPAQPAPAGQPTQAAPQTQAPTAQPQAPQTPQTPLSPQPQAPLSPPAQAPQAAQPQAPLPPQTHAPAAQPGVPAQPGQRPGKGQTQPQGQAQPQGQTQPQGQAQPPAPGANKWGKKPVWWKGKKKRPAGAAPPAAPPDGDAAKKPAEDRPAEKSEPAKEAPAAPAAPEVQ